MNVLNYIIYLLLILLSIVALIYSIVYIVKCNSNLKTEVNEEASKIIKGKRLIAILGIVFSSIIFLVLISYPIIIYILLNSGLIGM